MVICSKCQKEINNPTYLARQLGYLCGEHAREHGLMKIAEIDLEISGLKKERDSINRESILAFQNDCEHDWVDTGYGKIEDGKIKSIHRCSKCNLSNNEDF